ncbi:MAG: hypothetical protein K2I69_03655 [Muribaculaceae bacterium]|nr:hypothetical protein [Muribaculaceae bacterium]
MIQTDTIPQNVLDFIGQQITKVIVERIERDLHVADAYLRVLVDGNKFTIKALYIKEHFDEHQDKDVPLLDLMIDRNNLNGAEYWEPDYDAIHRLVQSFRNITHISINLN